MIGGSDLISRRRILQHAIGVAGGAAMLSAAADVAAAPKISKPAVAYQDHADADKRCDRCVQFQPPDACKMVDGPVSAQGSCRIFTPLRQT